MPADSPASPSPTSRTCVTQICSQSPATTLTPATRLPRAGQRTRAPLPWLGATRRMRQQHGRVSRSSRRAARLSICKKRTDARKAAACISFRPARRPPPQSWRRHEGPDPYTTHGRTRNQSVGPTQTSGTAALVRAARACDRPGLPQLCSSAPALPSVVPCSGALSRLRQRSGFL